jgi:cell volume regulation protein A
MRPSRSRDVATIPAVNDIIDFGRIILVVAGGLSVAIAVRVGASRIGLPTAALLLTFAAVASDLSERLASLLSFEDVQRVATLALIAILFDGGMSIGLRRFRSAAVPITILGVVGTFGTAPLMAVAAHYVLGFDWTVALLIGAALAPTDPAVTFSVLAGKEVEGRSGTILEGESGFNDPVGIALMIGMIELATVPEAGIADVAWEFLREMGVGLAVGAAAGFLLLHSLRKIPLPDRSLYPLAVVLAAGGIYGVTAVAHGSGFLAVFVAGIVVGDAEFPRRVEVRHFTSSLADLGELAVFVALGLTIDLGYIFAGAIWWQGLVLAVLLGFVVRPLVVTPLLLPSRLSRGERLFVTWAGLKGAVPILLASLAVVAGTDQALQIYEIVFVVVLFSVVVQGTLVPVVAQRLGVPMVDADP